MGDHTVSAMNSPARLIKVALLTLLVGSTICVLFWIRFPLFLACTTVGGSYEKFGGSPALCSWAMLLSALFFMSIFLANAIYIYRTVSLGKADGYSTTLIYPKYRRRPFVFYLTQICVLYFSLSVLGIYRLFGFEFSKMESVILTEPRFLVPTVLIALVVPSVLSAVALFSAAPEKQAP